MKQTLPPLLIASADTHDPADTLTPQWSANQAQHDTEQMSFETLDRLARAMTARFTHGVSPHAQYAAWFDWASHLSRAPGRQLELWLQAIRAATRLTQFVSQSVVATANPPFVATESDQRFDDRAWGSLPYVLWQQAFLAQEEWWRSATREVRGMAPRNAGRVGFMALQVLDMMSPSNVPWLNPVIVDRTVREAGANLVRGSANFAHDLAHALLMEPASQGDGLRVGTYIAATPGKSVV